jgi:hypothetical protein
VPKPFSDKYKLSVEGLKAHRILCADIHDISVANTKDAGQKYHAGDDRGGDEAARIAAAAQSDGKRLGCSWA